MTVARPFLLSFVAAALFLAVFPARAAEGIAGAVAVWERFRADLRRGDYPAAYAAFSPESREAYSYPEFLEEYGPAGIARELILTPPDSQSASMDGDWAEVVFGGGGPGTGARYSVTVALVRTGEEWGIVAARNEEREKAGAAARELLRVAWAARGAGDPAAVVQAVAVANADNPVFRQYRIEAGDGRFVAFPLRPGLRTWYVDGGGVQPVEAVRTNAVPGAARENSSGAGAAAAVRADPPREPPAVRRNGVPENGIPEMAEPPPPFFAPGEDDDFPEPPLIKPGTPGRPAEGAQPVFSLPEAIG